MKHQSLNDYTLSELKQLALEFDISPEQVAKFGDRRRRSTWLEAIRAAQQAGKTTQEHRELPIIKSIAIAAQAEKPQPESIAIAAQAEKPQQPDQSIWFDHPVFVSALEKFFLRQRRSGMIVHPSELKLMPLEDERFKTWTDWITPGNLFTVYQQNRTYQILAIDRKSQVYYMPLNQPKLIGTYLMFIRQFAYPTPSPDSGGIVEAADYIKLLHEATEEPYRCMERWA